MCTAPDLSRVTDFQRQWNIFPAPRNHFRLFSAPALGNTWKHLLRAPKKFLKKAILCRLGVDPKKFLKHGMEVYQDAHSSCFRFLIFCPISIFEPGRKVQREPAHWVRSFVKDPVQNFYFHISASTIPLFQLANQPYSIQSYIVERVSASCFYCKGLSIYNTRFFL